MKLPRELGDLPYADALNSHEGDLAAGEHYDGCHFTGMAFTSVRADNGRFVECAFSDVTLEDVSLRGAAQRRVAARRPVPVRGPGGKHLAGRDVHRLRQWTSTGDRRGWGVKGSGRGPTCRVRGPHGPRLHMVPVRPPREEEAAMAVIRFEPFRDPIERLFSMAAGGTRAPLAMPMDIYRTEDGSYHVEADLPGVDPGSVEVTVEHGTLTIQAERAALRRERPGRCRRAAPGVVYPAVVPGRGRGLGEPHRRRCRRCPARDHPGVTQGKGAPDRGQPCARRQPHHLGQRRRAGRGARWRTGGTAG